MEHFETTLSSKEIYKGRVFTAKVDAVRLENDSETTREYVLHPGGVAIAALDRQDNLLLVRQFRYPFGRELVELPAGKLEYGEDHQQCGRRELIEETGYEAGEFSYLGCLYPTPAYCSEIIHLYYATDLTEVSQNLDEDEFLSVFRVPLSKAVEMVMSGEISDAKSQIGILKVFAKRMGKV